MYRVAAAVLFFTLAACATGGDSTTRDAARTECQARGATEEQALRLCMDQIEEAVRVARENGGAPQPPRSQQRPSQPR